ncbi:hypothetical protein CDN99_27430 [Roseateles aquatilis]|uniref:DUF2244 domain-containing protein n=1 Tax=Roseateles aquatilis TaxID=431061 RepID=A0A246IS96_9BURK|nr:hypothetical protein [Roseateles aquatilis]OWQ83035.1 hypothetical protein CDN99_27430 [Roseateles aquatilis]
MRSDRALWQTLIAQSEGEPSVLLPKIEPHPAALVVGLGGTALGLWATRQASLPWREELGWLALAMVVAGMLMWTLMKRRGIGWRLDFASRRIAPEGEPGVPASLDAPGWRVCCVAGNKRRSLALEFRHEDGGRPLRVLQTRAGADRREHELVSRLADVIARRLSMSREGLSL